MIPEDANHQNALWVAIYQRAYWYQVQRFARSHETLSAEVDAWCAAQANRAVESFTRYRLPFTELQRLHRDIGPVDPGAEEPGDVSPADEIEADERRARAVAEGIEVARQRGFPQAQLDPKCMQCFHPWSRHVGFDGNQVVGACHDCLCGLFAFKSEQYTPSGAAGSPAPDSTKGRGSVERREAQPGQDASAGGAGGAGGYQRMSVVFAGGGGGYRGKGGDSSSAGGSGERHPSGSSTGAGSGNVPLVLLVPGACGGIGEGTAGRGSNGDAIIEPRPIDDQAWRGATSIVDDVPEGAEARGGGVTVSNRPICETEGCEREATTDGPNGTFLCDDCARGEP